MITEKNYWLNTFKTKFIKSAFIYDNIPEEDVQVKIKTFNYKFSDEFSSRMLRICNNSEKAMHVIFVAGISFLLKRYSGNPDVITGSPIFKQKYEGDYINTILSNRIFVDENKTFKEYLLDVRKVLLEAHQHQNYSIDALLYNLGITYDSFNLFPLFDVLILIEGIHEKKYVKDIKTNSLFCFSITDGYIEGFVDYNALRYKKETIVRILDQLTILLTNALSNPEIRLEEIEILTEDNKELIANSYNDSKKKKVYDDSIQLLINIPKYEKLYEYWVEQLLCEYQNTNIFNPGNNIPDKNELEFIIELDIVREINKITINNDISLFIVLVTVVNILLYKYNKNNNIFILSPLLKSKISSYTMNDRVLIKGIVNNEFRFKDLINHIKESIISAYKHQDYPYNEMVKRIFNGAHPTDILCSLNTIHDSMNIKNIQESISFNFHKSEDSLKVCLKYNSYNYQFVKQISNHFNVILNSVIKEKDILISDISCMTKSERDKLLYEFNDTKTDFQKDKLYLDLLDNQVDKSSDSIIASKGNDQITYKELNRQASLLAGELQIRGVQKGEIVGVYLDRGIDLLVSMIGILKSGGIFFLIDPLIPVERIHNILKDSRLNYLIGDLLYQESLEKIKDYGVDLDFICINELKSIVKDKNIYEPVIIDDSDLSYLIYTSGTSGLPKGVMIHHGGLLNHIYSKIDLLNLTLSDIIAQTASVSFDICVWQFLSVILLGGRVCIFDTIQTLDPTQLFLQLKKERISIFESVPSLVKILLENLNHIPDLDLPCLRWMIPTGEALSASLVRKWYENYPTIKIVNAYGPTEASDDITHYVVSDILQETQISVPIGKPIRNMRIYILDELMQLCPIGVVGEICVSGIGVGRGYLNDVNKTSKSFIPNPFIEEIADDYHTVIYKTGDFGYYYEDGNIECLGRIDDQVKIRGYRIELGEIQSYLQLFKSITNSVVITIGENEDKLLCAYYVSKEEIDISELRNYLSSMLPEYMIPSFYMQIENIPLTKNGKVDKKSLPVVNIVENDDYEGPSNEIEEQLVDIWSEVLNTTKEEVSVTSNFFAVGGHSLKAVILIGKIHEDLGVEFPLRDVFVHSTIRSQAERIKYSDKKDFISIPKAKDQDYYVLSSAQRRLYLLQQMDLESTAYNIPYLIPLGKAVDKDKIEMVFIQLISRHESFRTSFILKDEKPVQQIHEQVDFRIEEYSIDKKKKQGLRDHFIKAFDLSQAPCMRVALVNIKGEGHLLMIDMHHIISDGVSHAILEQEFQTLYSGGELQNLKLQYKDYSEWQNSDVYKEKVEGARNYWLTKFSGEIPILDFQTDYNRPSEQSHEGARVSFALTREETSNLNILVKDHKLTMYMSILSVFNILLSKLSGQEDIIIGSPVEGRVHPDLKKVVGMFVNTLPLRNEVRAGERLKEFIARLRQSTIDAFNNQVFQFEDIVSNVSVDRDMRHNPIFDVMFNMLNYIEYKGGLSGFVPGEYIHEPRQSKFDLTLTAITSKDQILLEIEYCTRLFKPETINRFISYFRSIVNQIPEKIGSQILEINLLTPLQQKQLLNLFNDTKVDYPRDKTIIDLFEKQVEKSPERIAVKLRDENISYKELNDRSNQFARYLEEKEIIKNPLIPIYSDSSIELLISMIGIFKAGGTYIPVDENFPIERLNAILEDSEAQILITKTNLLSEFIRNNGLTSNTKLNHIINMDHKATDKFSEGRITIVNLDTIEKYSKNRIEFKSCPEDLTYIIYTSGTTGKPKGAMIHHAGMLNHLYAKINTLSITNFDIIAQTASISFDISVWQFLAALLVGGKTHIIEKEISLEPTKFLKILQQGNITVLESVPSLMTVFLDITKQISDNRLKTLRWMIPTGEALSVSLARKWYESYPEIKLLNAYGPTEASDDIAHYIVEEAPNEQAISISIGKPIQNMHIYILDNNLNLCPVGVKGEICVSGIGVGRGYWKDIEKTQKAFIKNPFYKQINDSTYSIVYKTGDLGYYREDGNIECLGRNDHQVKIRGNRIELGEIESILLNHEQIKGCAVLVREQNGNKYLCAYIESSKEIDPIGLRDYLSQRLPDYMIPSFFVGIEKIPLTANGKLNRHALPEPEIQRSDYVSPRNDTEEKLVEVWSEVLGIQKENISINANFFELGGDSIKTIQIASRITRYGLKLTVADIFRYPRIESLSSVLRKNERVISQELVTGEIPLTPIQSRLLNDGFTNIHHYNNSVMLYKKDRFDLSILNKVFKELTRHHDVLRTTYNKTDGLYNQNNNGLDKNYYSIESYNFRDKENYKELVKDQSAKIQSSINITAGPLIKVGHFITDTGDHLLIVIHHLVIDGVSWRILLEDFSLAYTSVLKGRDIEFPLKTDSFKYWAERLQEYANSPKLLKEKLYWEKVSEYEIPILPKDYLISREQKINKNQRSISVHFNELNTDQLLKSSNKAYNTEINDILLSALVRSICEWCNVDKIAVEMEGHGRESLFDDIDINRTVGWFTTYYPVALKESKDMSTLIKGVKEELRQIPHKGIGIGLLKYLRKNTKINFNLKPEVIFNYLGDFSGSGISSFEEEKLYEFSPLSSGESINPLMESLYALDITGMTSNGVLSFTFRYNMYEFSEETIIQLTKLFKKSLFELHEHCNLKEDKELTPSDYGLKNISLDDLDNLKSRINLLDKY